MYLSENYYHVTYNQLKTQLLGKRDIIKEIQDYDPVAVQKKIKFINATKATKGLTEEVVKKSSFAVWLLYQWVMTSWDLRKQAVELRKKAVDEGKEDQPLDEEVISMHIYVPFII